MIRVWLAGLENMLLGPSPPYPLWFLKERSNLVPVFLPLINVVSFILLVPLLDDISSCYPQSNSTLILEM